MRRIPVPGQRPDDVQWPAYFDSTAQDWDSSYNERTLRAHRKRARHDMAVQLIGDGPGSLVEIGVSSGRLLAELATRGWAVSGIDAAPRMIELARARIPPPAGRLAVARRRLARSRACCARVRREFVVPIVRYVKRGVPFGRPFQWPRLRHVSLDQARRLLTAVGLSVERVEDIVSFVFPGPLDCFAPGLAYRAALAAERSPRLRRLFGTQLLFVCRKNL